MVLNLESVLISTLDTGEPCAGSQARRHRGLAFPLNPAAHSLPASSVWGSGLATLQSLRFTQKGSYFIDQERLSYVLAN